MLDGEKAQRTETARQLAETERRAATVPEGPQHEELAAKTAELQAELKQQSEQVRAAAAFIRTLSCLCMLPLNQNSAFPVLAKS